MTLEYIRLSCKQPRKQLIWDTILIPPITGRVLEVNMSRLKTSRKICLLVDVVLGNHNTVGMRETVSTAANVTNMMWFR